MKAIPDDVEGLELSIRDGETGRIRLAVLDGGDVQSFLGGRMRDQLNDRFQRGERFGTPVDGNERKEAMFDRVPFAGGRRIMRHGDRELFFIGQALQAFFHSLLRTPLLPPPSAVISSSDASGDSCLPQRFQKQRESHLS
jgi:hypothetical protein